ncbi:MAG: methyltransferase [Alphaproteobacteria bacterium]|nr:methyltransferase [Alphaproteobacteria bacterium]
MERRDRAAVSARRREHQAERRELNQIPWRQPRNPYAPTEILSADQIESIHLASLRILEEIGVRILLPEAREIYAGAGADVDEGTQQVRFDRGLILGAMATVPPEFTLHARNPAHDVIMGGSWAAFATVGGAPSVSDIERGRRPGNFADYSDMLRLAQSLNVVHVLAGYAPEPIDVPVPVRHMVAMEAMIRLTDKAYFGFSLSRQRVLDNIEMIRIARGLTPARLDREASFYTVVNTNSPLQLDRPMLWGIIEMARANQVTCVTPFTLAGAMAPVTLAGALALQNAEALAGMALAQIVRPGSPLIYGGFTSNVDMRSGAPAFGTPEYIKAAQIGGQLARRYRVPYRSSNVNASNAPDAQSAYEGAMSIWGALTGHTNLLIHGVGWLEGGLCASYEKFIIDAEMLQIMAKYFEPEVIDDATLAIEAIREVGPGGHFFGSPHTLERYETAFYTPLLSDWRSFQQWEADGSVDATRRAHRIYQRMLAEYEAPALDPAIAEELGAFIAKRTEEGGAPIQ